MENLRRKLLKSSAALPVILTVRQASGNAKTSLVQCLEADAKKKPHEVFAYDSYTDEFMRAKKDILELEYWDDGKKKWVEIKDRRFYLGMDNSTYWELDRDDPYRAPAKPSSHRKGYGVREKKKGERHTLVYVKDDGHVVGEAWEKHGGNHCSKSCWASLVPKYKGY
jgi:hypothetical protein